MALLKGTVPLKKEWKIQPNGKKKYVYKVIESKYIKEKKYNIEKRVVIGQLMDDGSVRVNENFKKYYPEDEIQFLDEKQEKSVAVKIGAATVVHEFMEELKINKLISESRSILDDDLCACINDLVVHQLVEESAVAQHYKHFIFNHPNKSKEMTDDFAIGKFYKDLETLMSSKLFLKKWNKLREENRRVFVSYDSTNHPNYSKSNGVTLNELGNAKTYEDVEQINVAYAVEQITGTPLFYDLYKGSINDVEQGKLLSEFAKEIGITSINLVFDRGYFCEKTVDELRKNGFGFLMMLKTNNLSFKEIISEENFIKDDPSNLIDGEDLFAQTKVGKLFKSDLNGEEVYFHIFYSAEQFSKEQVAFAKAFRERLNTLNDNPNEYNPKNIYDACTTKNIDENGIISFSSDNKKINEAMKFNGYFCLVSSMELTAEKALEIYRERDVVEKLFRALKSHLGANVDHVQSDSSIRAKAFTTFISSIIRSEIFSRTKELRKKNKRDYTVPEILCELEDIEAVKGLNGRYDLRSALTKQQKTILSSLGVTNRMVEIEANRLNKVD